MTASRPISEIEADLEKACSQLRSIPITRPVKQDQIAETIVVLDRELAKAKKETT